MKGVDVIVKVYEVDFHKVTVSTAVSRKSVNTSFDELKVERFNSARFWSKPRGIYDASYNLSIYW